VHKNGTVDFDIFNLPLHRMLLEVNVIAK